MDLPICKITHLSLSGTLIAVWSRADNDMFENIVPFNGNSGKNGNGYKTARNGHEGEPAEEDETFPAQRSGSNAPPFLRRSTNRANGNNTERITCQWEGRKGIPGSYLKSAKCIQKSNYSTGIKVSVRVEISENSGKGRRRAVGDSGGADWRSTVLYILMLVVAFCGICPKRIYLRPFHSFT